jgi:xanthine dehydrogenase accessory factor
MLLHQKLLESIIAALSGGERVALCAVVKTRGSTPQSPGAMLLLDQRMGTVGTLGGGCVEAEVCKRAFALLERGASELLSFQLDHDYGWDDGLICGGGMDVAVTPLIEKNQAEPIRRVLADLAAGRDARVPLRVRTDAGWVEYAVRVEAEPQLVIAGAGHVGAQLARLAVELEFDVTVIDDRADFANRDRLPPPIKPLVGDIEQSLRAHPMSIATPTWSS